MTEAARLLVTVAHPDDETFGTGSVIALAAEHGAHVTVCCATRGEAGDVRGLTSATEIGAVREAELRSAGTALGVAQFIVLDYLDSGMTGEPGPRTLAGAPFGDVISDVRNVVDQIKPDVVVTLDPDHGDGHRDHAVIAQATVQACRHLPEVRGLCLGPAAATASSLVRRTGKSPPRQRTSRARPARTRPTGTADHHRSRCLGCAIPAGKRDLPAR